MIQCTTGYLSIFLADCRANAFETVLVVKKLTVYCLIGIHLAFLGLVIFGGVLIWWQFNIVYIHMPALVWAIVIELLQRECPLTRWENQLRSWAQLPTYSKGFIEHYVFFPLLGAQRPAHFELCLTLAVVSINLLSYLCLFAVP